MDALVFSVRPDGPACHTGEKSCFFNEVDVPGGEEAAGGESLPGRHVLESVYKVILERRDAADTGGSYVARLFEKGTGRILSKVTEEAEEVVRAIKEEEGGERVVEETADLWFHSLVALVAAGVPPERVFDELARRFGKGGRPEST
jgi:phosphoribosyl-ATP pyrophosphohydrolase/phosphoribosyl-AMP cyclohydrolase